MFIKLIVSLLLFYLLSVKATDKKNVLILIADDFGLQTSIYNDPVIETPNLRSLAQRSVKFNNAFTTVSSCSPSRSSILSGLPPHQNGMYGIHGGYNSLHFNSYDRIKSLPNIVRQKNVRTGIIGKKNVGPSNTYKFDFEETEETHDLVHITRNITLLKLLTRQFLESTKNSSHPFLFYIGFGDPHRCDFAPKLGLFCENFGSGQPNMGLIPDWKPKQFDPASIKVPYYLPDTQATRYDLSKYYTSVDRLDQGIGLILNELSRAGHLNDTLIIFTSDNGLPFPVGKTNFYEPGIREPFLISNPKEPQYWGSESNFSTSHLDILPTVLDWLDIKFPDYKLFKIKVNLTGQSLLPHTSKPDSSVSRNVFASHGFHFANDYYPMRAIRTPRYKLIHNIKHGIPYPMIIDLLSCPTFQDILNRTINSQPTGWFKTVEDYYYRSEWELFDLINDPEERRNLYGNSNWTSVAAKLKKQLIAWERQTSDPYVAG